MVPAELEDTLSALESVLLLLVGLDALGESVGEGQEEVGKVAASSLVELLRDNVSHA